MAQSGAKVKSTSPPKPDVFRPNPDRQALADTHHMIRLRSASGGPMTPERMAAARAGADARPAEHHVVELGVVPGPGGDIEVRIIRPKGPASAVLISVHGGGWIIGSAADDDWLNDQLALRSQVATVSMDYRLAPENPHPAALQDVAAVISWVGNRSLSEFGTDRLLISGRSAGAHLAMHATIALRETRSDLLQRVAAVNLTYGVYDISMTPSMRRVSDEALIISREGHTRFLDFAFPSLDAEARRDPSISPLYADRAGLPPALFSVGTLDPLMDDTLFAAARWESAGNSAQLDIWPDCTHLFDTYEPVVGGAFADRLSSWFNAQLHTA